MEKSYFNTTAKRIGNLKNQNILSAFLIILSGLSFINSAGQVTTVNLTATGPGNFNVPVGVTSINIEAWGGGGGGGGSNSNNNGGSGGGGGGYTQLNNIAVSPGNLAYVVGVGGAGTNTNGAAGGQTSILGLIANGGGGGLRNNGVGGAGGTASGGLTNIAGGNGGSGGNSTGGSGGNSPNGGTGGSGGNNANGTGGNIIGGGGGGGEYAFFSNKSGGNGARGQIRITYIQPTLSAIPASACANSTLNLTGTNFIAPLMVTFNGVAASSITVISANLIQVVVPAGATTGNIRITTATGFTTNPGTCIINNPILGGPNSVCEGDSINLTPASGGSWNSDNPSAATIDNSGFVTGIAAGTAMMTFTETASGCQATKTITVNPLPTIGSQPTSQAACTGTIVTFTVGASITGLTYQWYKGPTPIADGGNISGAATSTLTFNTVTIADAAPDYHCVVSGACLPAVASIPASLSVNEKITIIAQPAATQTTCTGSSVSFSVTVTGDSSTFQWYNGATALTDGGNISGSATSTLTLNPVALTDASANYYCIISGIGACLPVSSSNAALLVNELPIILSNPVSTQTVCDDDPVSLSILATGGGLTYQWFKGGIPVTDGGNISGSNTDTLNFVPIHVGDSAPDYYCVVTNACTSIPSTPAEVIVNLKPKIPDQSTTTCSDTGFSMNLINGVPDASTFIPAGTTYFWNAPAVTGGMTGGTSETGQSTVFGTLTNPTNIAQTATYLVTPTSGTAGFCAGDQFTVTVTVNPVPNIANLSPSICSGEPLVISPSDGGANIVPAGTTYSWVLPSVTGGLTGATIGTNEASFAQTLDNPTNTLQTATYNITASSPNCLGSTFTVIVTVNPKPTIAVSLPAQSVCSGIAFAPITFSNPNNVAGTITYNWVRDNTAVVTGLPASGTGTISGILSQATAMPQTTTFTIYAYSDEGCISLAGTAAITVSPNPVVNFIADQTICSGQNITAVNLSASIAGTTFTWTRNNTANITGILDAAGNTISGNLINLTNIPQITTFTIIPAASGCSDISNAIVFDVLVNPATAASAAPASQTVCGGGVFSITLSDANNVAGTTYSFTKDSAVAGDAVSIAGNIISGTLENNSGADRVVTFTITATANGCPSTTTATVTVKPNPAFALAPGAQSICNGGTITTINFPAVAGVTYSWTRTNPLASGNLSGMPDSDTNVTSISGSLTNLTAVNQTTIFTVTATINGCSKTATVSITVYTTMTDPVISDTQTVCSGSRPTPLVMTTLPTGGTGTYTYQWQSAAAAAGPWANIAGATAASYWPPTTSAATPTTFYHLVVSNPCGTVTSNELSVAVANNLNFTFSISGGSTTVCPGQLFSPSIDSGQLLPDSYIRYSWAADANYITPNTGGPIGTTTVFYIFGFPIWAVSSADLSLTTINNTGATVTTTVFITPKIYDVDTNALICSLSPRSVTVTILPKPVAVITAPANSTLICSATTAGVTATSTMTGTFTVTRSVNASVTSSAGFPIVSGSTAAGIPYSFTDNLTNFSGLTQPVTYTVTPNSAAGCAGTPQTITINVAPQLLPGTIGTNHTICYNGDPNPLTETLAATGATSYSWEKSTVSAAGPWTPIAGASAPTYDDPGPLTQTTWYRRIVSSSVSGMPCSVAVTTPVQVTVNTLTAGTIGNDQTICSGSGAVTINSISAGGGLPAISYQWQSNTTGCAATFFDIAGATGTTYTVPAGLAVTTYFRRITKSSAATCEIAGNCVTVYVNNVTGGAVGNDENLCNTTNPSAFTEITASTGSGALTYQWQSTTSATGCSAASTWNTIAFATLSTYDPPAGVVVTTWFRRITTSTLNGVQCTAMSNCIMITANSVTAGTIGPNSRTVCSGGDPAVFNSTLAGTGTGLSYQWQSSPSGAAGTWADISGATAASYDPPGPMTTTTYFRRVATGTVGVATCQAFTTPVTVFVNDVSASTIAGDQTVCQSSPASFTVSTPATAAGTLTYQWQSNSTGCGGVWTDIPGATSSTYTPAVAGQTIYYHVVAISTLNGVQCVASSNCVTVTNFGKIWNGSVDSNWFIANNWTPNGVPTAANCVVIPNVTPWHCVISGSGSIGYANSVTVLNGGILEVYTDNNIVITNSAVVNVGGVFNVMDSANLVQINNVANSGTVNVFRITQPMYRFDYTYWNSPMVLGSFTLGDLSQNLTQFDKYYSWNPSFGGGNGGWVQESTATIMDPTKGYIVRAPNSFSFTPTFFQPYTATFTGTPNNGDIAIPIAIGSLGAGTVNDKLNLIGNPFASAVSALAFVNDPTNVPLVDGTLYFWTHHAPPSAAYPNPFYGTFEINYSPDGYASLNALGGTTTVPAGYGGPTPNDNVASGQSFFIVGKASGNAFFRNSMRRTGDNSTFFRTSNPFTSAPTEFESHRIWLNMADAQNSFSQILIGYAQGATNDHDRNYDGESLDSGGVSLYSVGQDRNYIIQGRALPFDVDDIVPLGYNASVSNEFTIGIDHLDGWFENQEIYLEDRLLNVIHNIRQSAYTFTTEAGTFNSRFEIRYTDESLGVEIPDADFGLTAFIKNGKIHVRADKNIDSIAIYDLAGKLITIFTPGEASHLFDSEFVFAQGVYFGKITLSGGMIATLKLSNGN